MKSSNPTFRQDVLNAAAHSQTPMTVNGTIQKTAILFVLTVVGAGWGWMQLLQQGEMAYAMAQKYATYAGMAGFALWALISFALRKYSPYLAPLYALVEGFCIGAVTMIFEARYPGIAIQAALGTFAVLGVMLFLYRSKIITVTQRLRSVVITGMSAIFFVYLANFVLSFFGISIPFLHQSGPIGMGISLVVMGFLAFTLLINFDWIENCAAAKADKYMEWYCGFGILVTMVWLYMEIISFLARMRD